MTDARDVEAAAGGYAWMECRRLRQGLWDIYAALGFDTDGDKTPDAVVGDLVAVVLSAAREYRADTDKDVDALLTELDKANERADRLIAAASSSERP